MEGQATLPLSGCTFAWLHRAPLEDALRRLAAHGLRTLELTTAPPHLLSERLDRYRRAGLARTLRELELRPISLNPTFVDLNLISTNPEVRDLSERQLLADIELAAELEVPYVVVLPGRRHTLAPAPADVAAEVFRRGLDRLLARAEALGVTITLENSPYGFLGAAADLIGIVEAYGSPRLKITYDVANALALEDPAQGARRLGLHLAVAHVSDTWRDRWAHTSPGRGDVDFAAFAAALRDIGFTGPTVYELADGEDPEPRLAADLRTLAAHGWSSSAAPSLPGR